MGLIDDYMQYLCMYKSHPTEMQKIEFQRYDFVLSNINLYNTRIYSTCKTPEKEKDETKYIV